MTKAVFLLFLLFLMPAVSFAETPKLSFAPPEQVDPLHIKISYAEDPTMIDVDHGNGNITQSSITERVVIELSDDQDAIIELPKDRILAIPGLGISGGHNVRLVGGHLMAIAPADKSLRALLRFAGQSGSVFVEGVVVDTKQQYGLDGILVGSVRHKPGVIGDVYIQNCLIKNVSSTKQGLHADGFQYYGSTGWTYMDRVTIRSQYQGLFLDPQAEITGIDLRHVDMDYIDPATGAGYIFFLHHEANMKRHPEVRLTEVYAGERTNRTPWQEFSIYPPSSRLVGNVTRDGKASFPAFPEVKGFVTKGSPPSGAFVKEEEVGRNYISPGYVD